jgi:hypothetical protein
MQLVGDLIHMFGRQAAERIVEEHYRRNQRNVRSSLDEHLREFGTAWDGMRKKIVDSLSPDEQQAFNALSSEHQREGFMIVRAFAGAAARNGKKDFAIAQASLADRLSITPPGATDVIQKLCELKVIAQTQPYVRHKKPARFCWLLPMKAVQAPVEPPETTATKLFEGETNQLKPRWRGRAVTAFVNSHADDAVKPVTHKTETLSAGSLQRLPRRQNSGHHFSVSVPLTAPPQCSLPTAQPMDDANRKFPPSKSR